MGRDKWFHLNDNWRVDLPDVFAKMMKEIKPTLVVIDSLGATSDLTDAKENEGAYAQPLYDISQRNGDEEREDGFPAAAVLCSGDRLWSVGTWTLTTRSGTSPRRSPGPG